MLAVILFKERNRLWYSTSKMIHRLCSDFMGTKHFNFIWKAYRKKIVLLMHVNVFL